MQKFSHQKTVMKIAQSVWIYVKRHWSWSETLSFAWKFYKKNQIICTGKLLKATPRTCDELCRLAMKASYLIIREVIRIERKKAEELKAKQKKEKSFINRVRKWLKSKFSIGNNKLQTA